MTMTVSHGSGIVSMHHVISSAALSLAGNDARHSSICTAFAMHRTVDCCVQLRERDFELKHVNQVLVATRAEVHRLPGI